MLRVKDGDGASFGVLLEKHRSSVVHFLYRMIQNHAVAEELGAGGFSACVSFAEYLRADGQVHDLAVSDRDASGAQLAA